MKKFLKMFAVFAMAICSCFSFVGCNESTPQNPETEQGTVKKQLTTQQFTALKEAVAKTTNENTYKNGYTLTSIEKGKMQFTVDEENFNPQGDAWTEEAKTEFVNEQKENFTAMERENSNTKEIISFNATDKTGYKVTYSYDADNNATLEDFDKVVAETDGSYNLYHYYRQGASDAKDKYTVDENYYKNYIVDYFDEDAVFALQLFNQEDLDSLKAVFESEFAEMPGAQTTLTYIEENGVYTVYIDMTATITEPMEVMMGMSLTSGTVGVTMTVKFDNNGMKSILMNIAMNGDMEMPVDSNPLNTITINMNMTMDMGYEYSMSYNSEYLPAFDETIKAEDFVEKTGASIHVYYYVNGHAYDVDTSAGFGETVDLDTFEDTQVNNPTSVKWYLDPECTQEFTATTYPSHSIKLYTNVTLAEGKAFVKRTDVSSEAGVAYGEYGLSIEEVDIASVNYGTVNADYYTCAYVNGVKVNAGEAIVLNPAIVNTIVFVIVAED